MPPNSYKKIVMYNPMNLKEASNLTKTVYYKLNLQKESNKLSQYNERKLLKIIILRSKQ